jgi:hypothetical protein
MRRLGMLSLEVVTRERGSGDEGARGGAAAPTPSYKYSHLYRDRMHLVFMYTCLSGSKTVEAFEEQALACRSIAM